MVSVAGMRRGAFAIGFATVVAACSSWQPQEPSLSGWPLGEEVGCQSALGQDSGLDIVAIARTGLDSGDETVSAVACYREGSYLTGGSPVILIRTGAAFVVAFTFTDGTRKGVGIHCAARCIVVLPPNGPPG